MHDVIPNGVWLFFANVIQIKTLKNKNFSKTKETWQK